MGMTDHEIHTLVDEKHRETIGDVSALIEGFNRANTLLITTEMQSLRGSINQLTERVGKQNGRVGKLEDRALILETGFAAHQGEGKGEVKAAEKFTVNWNKVLQVLTVLIALAGVFYAAGNSRKTEKRLEAFGVPIVTRNGQILALPDSTKILFFGNDSVKYTIKRDETY